MNTLGGATRVYPSVQGSGIPLKQPWEDLSRYRPFFTMFY